MNKKIIFLATVALQFFASLANAELHIPKRGMINVGFTVAQESSGAIAGYSFKSFDQRGAFRAYLEFQSLNLNNVPNAITGDYDDSGAWLFGAGIRMTSMMPQAQGFQIIDFGVVQSAVVGDFSKNASTGVSLGLGYAILLFETYLEKDKHQGFAFIKINHVFGLDRADKITNKPDYLNGAYVNVGILTYKY